MKFPYALMDMMIDYATAQIIKSIGTACSPEVYIAEGFSKGFKMRGKIEQIQKEYGNGLYEDD